MENVIFDIQIKNSKKYTSKLLKWKETMIT